MSGAGVLPAPGARLEPRPAYLAGLSGRIEAQAPLAPQAWFRVGGPAEWLVRPSDVADLLTLLRHLPDGVPLTVLGAASNLIIRDGGIAGVVLRLPARGFGAVEVEPDGIVAGAAALDVTVAEQAAAAGLAGLEFLCGIPGSLGGALAMNAGAYGRELRDVLDWAEIATARGVRRYDAAMLALAYREASLPPRGVVIRLRLRAGPGERAAIAGRMAAIREAREAAQPVRARTGGSTFRNPEGHKAWALIDAAGCRGLALGGAQVSGKHANFLLNTGGATAADIEALGELVRSRVLAHCGIDLRWEIKRVGAPRRGAGP